LSIRQYEKKPYTINETDLSKMKEEIRSQCNLPKGSEKSYPWYYHYQLGLALSTKNDWQRALDSFIAALDHRDQPQKLTRTYGMWFLDYYPYYNIGVAHYHLQNWKCAENSFKLSQSYDEVPKSSNEYRNLQEYLSEVRQNEVQ